MLGPPAAASYKHALLLSQSHQPATRLATYQPLMQRSHAASYLSPGSRNCGLLGIGCLVQMCTALPPPRRCCCNRSLHMPAPMGLVKLLSPLMYKSKLFHHSAQPANKPHLCQRASIQRPMLERANLICSCPWRSCSTSCTFLTSSTSASR